MKKTVTIIALALMSQAALAQTDSTKIAGDTTKPTIAKIDTLQVGNIVIITRSKGANDTASSRRSNWMMPKRHRSWNTANVHTNWGVIDFGFNNYGDHTNYAQATAGQYLVNAPGSNFALGASDFKLNAAKSLNVNLWLFMQRVNISKHRLNLKYGLGLELNNYRYRSAISFKEPGFAPYALSGGIGHPFTIRDSISFSKNKLAADYVTVPLMLNFCSNPADPKKGILVSVGVSAGYLYSQRNKQVKSEGGKRTLNGDLGVAPFKFAYIAELGLGPVRLYGSYSPKSLFENGLDLRPYAFGIRLSSW